MKNANIPYEKIAAYLKNELPEKDRNSIDNWISESQENKTIFEQLKLEWIYLEADQPVSINKDRVWDVISKHIFNNPQSSEKTVTKSMIIKVAGIAASIALLVGIASSLFVKSTIDNISRESSVTVVETPIGQKMLMTLPDKTKVWLNSGSQLSYSENFNKGNREITLVGEAYFDVTSDASQKFIVKTSDVNVVVKGTSFEVSAYDEDELIKVSLVEGSVDITDVNNTLLTKMHPNELVKVNKKNMQYVLIKNNKAVYPLWTQEQLVFYNADLFEVMKKIERWYGVKIDLVNPIVDQKYTFSVKSESIRELLDLFDKLTPIEYTVNGKEVQVKCK